MKKFGLIFVFLLLLVSCHNVKEEDSTLVNRPLASENSTIESLNKLEKFSIKASELYFQDANEGNEVFSPLSLFFQLSMIQSLNKNTTSKEILSALGMNGTEIKTIAGIYKNNKVVYGDHIDIIEEEKLEAVEESFFGIDNSIWMNQDYTINTSLFPTIINNFNSNIYKTNFNNINLSLKKYIQNFMKNIDIQMPEIDSSAILSVMNLMFLKDVWATETLKESEKFYQFNDKNIRMLMGTYCDGMVYEEESFKSFYILTKNGFKLTFVLPKDAYTLKDVFNQKTLQKLISNKYKTVVGDTYYKTRCIFPKFKISSSKSLKDVCHSLGIHEMFLSTSEYTICDYNGSFISDIKQNIYLDVNQKGIDGGAITYSSLFGDSSKKTEYNDFVIDRSFGFLITEQDTNTILFSGTIHNI